MHVPGYIEKLPELRKKGVDIVAVIAFNDAFVMSAWGKINGMKDEDIVSRAIPWTSLIFQSVDGADMLTLAVHGGY